MKIFSPSKIVLAASLKLYLIAFKKKAHKKYKIFKYYSKQMKPCYL